MSTKEPVTPPGGDGLLRIRLDFAYDGTAFSGWATQPGRRTVEEELSRGSGRSKEDAEQAAAESALDALER